MILRNIKISKNNHKPNNQFNPYLPDVKREQLSMYCSSNTSRLCAFTWSPSARLGAVSSHSYRVFQSKYLVWKDGKWPRLLILATVGSSGEMFVFRFDISLLFFRGCWWVLIVVWIDGCFCLWSIFDIYFIFLVLFCVIISGKQA